MIASRRFHWLLVVLLLLGQQFGVLHQLGHGLGDAARVIASASSAQSGGGEAAGQPGSEVHAGACLLCVGFGGATATPTPPGLPPAPALGFARPLADVAEPRPVVATGTPIRGPPAAFSRLA